MPLADKIIELRKKQGWSQIDLADRLDVSRQSVSKWEMAQAVPELDKIIRMSELFAVTTDYLLKDDAPKPDPSPQPEPGPIPEPQPEPVTPPEPEMPQKPRRKMWRRVVLAAVLFLAALCTALLASGVATREKFAPAQVTASDPDAVEDGMTEYVYAGESVTGGGFDEAALAAMAAEYAPYGLTCDGERHWYLDGQRIRVFTDVLASNGESLTGGDFHGTLRTFCGDGFVDVRTVRDYDHCDSDGVGKLLYMESCDVRQDSAHWTEHHAQGHDDGDHHE